MSRTAMYHINHDFISLEWSLSSTFLITYLKTLTCFAYKSHIVASSEALLTVLISETQSPDKPIEQVLLFIMKLISSMYDS